MNFEQLKIYAKTFQNYWEFVGSDSLFRIEEICKIFFGAAEYKNEMLKSLLNCLRENDYSDLKNWYHFNIDNADDYSSEYCKNQ